MTSERVSVAGMYFDAVFTTNHTQTLTKTAHPVEHGADITDHAFMEPEQVSMEIGMSDVVSGNGSSVNLYHAMLDLQRSRQPVPVVTRLKNYQNMLITSISSPDDYTTTFGLRATINFEEIIIVYTGTVAVSPKASAEPHKTNSTNNGTQQPVNTDTEPSGVSVTSSASEAEIGRRARENLYGLAAA